jgi:hypothetical protein
MNEVPTNALGQVADNDVPPGLRPGNYAHDWLPASLPRSWEVVRECPNGRRYLNAGNGMSVIASGWEVQLADGTWEQWMHVSFARKSKMPELKDAHLVQGLFCRGQECVLRLHPNTDDSHDGRVVHLYARADGKPCITVPEWLTR